MRELQPTPGRGGFVGSHRAPAQISKTFGEFGASLGVEVSAWPGLGSETNAAQPACLWDEMACNTNVSLSGGSTDGLQGQKGAEHVILVAVAVEAPRSQFGRIPAARLSQLSGRTCDEVAQWHHTQYAADQLASAGNTKHAVWQWPPCCNSAMLHHHRPRAFRPARHGVPESNPEAHRPKGSNLDGEASPFLINNIIRPHVMTLQRCLLQCRGLDCVRSRQLANNAAVQELADVPWPASALGCRHLGRIRHNRLAHR